jgi:hypothetical protein
LTILSRPIRLNYCFEESGFNIGFFVLIAALRFSSFTILKGDENKAPTRVKEGMRVRNSEFISLIGIGAEGRKREEF